ncbi:hypothetical protein LTS14_001272 [Recurvomyces mirabilis]|uniref:uncharacterized protein n=1 Tax=Recurvomyces mirabilis TaxID=574656 RepID=UPI002DE0A1FE|nr:hypothetical protein LTS14_001272 [Recurvomyces mirabilis]
MAANKKDSWHLGLPDWSPNELHSISEGSRSQGRAGNPSSTAAALHNRTSPFEDVSLDHENNNKTSDLAQSTVTAPPPTRMAIENSLYSIPESFVTAAPSFHQPRPPQRPRSAAVQALQSSLSKISLTPNDIAYPVSLLRSGTTEDLTRAERLLGLRRHSDPKPKEDIFALPAITSKDISTSTGSLPRYNFEVPGSARQAEPLNGRTAWLHALTGALVVFNCWGLANAFGLFQAYYERYYLAHTNNANPSAISWIGSTQLALVFGLGVPVGRLVDKGYFRLVFHSGSIITVLGIFCTAWCRALWSLWLVQGLITGLGMVLMTWFDERKLGAAMGLSAAGSCIGGIVYIVLARKFLLSHGFPTTMRILGGVAAIALVPPNLIFRVRGQRHRSSRGNNRQNEPTKPYALTWRTFTSKPYLLAAGGIFFAFLGIYFGFVYIVLFASTQLHLSDTGATNLLIYMLAANLPGRFLPALISDRCIGPLNTIIPSIFLSAACVGLWISLGEGPGARGALTVVACFYGFVSAGVQVLYAPTVYAFCLEPTVLSGTAKSSTPPTTASTASDRERVEIAMDRIGVKAGGIFTCIGLACLVGTPIGGALVQYRQDRGLARPYLAAQGFAMGCLVLGGALLLASRVARVGWGGRRA